MRAKSSMGAAVLAGAMILTASSAFAQAGSAEAEARERALLEQRAAQEEQRRTEEALLVQEREIRRAQQEMEQARMQLERAARELAQIQAGRAAPRINIERRYAFAGDRSYLGINIEDDDDGVRVVGVTPGGAAAQAGLQADDVITAINGVDLTAGDRAPSEAVVATLRDVEPGAIVSVAFSRDGDAQSVDVETQAGAAYAFNLRRAGPGVDVTAPTVRVLPGDGRFFPNLPGIFASRWRDMELVTLTEELGRYFGTDAGLLVVRAPVDDAVGLIDGDVILEIGGRTPNSPEHAMRILTSFAPGEMLEFRIMRQQRRETIEYEIPGGEE